MSATALQGRTGAAALLGSLPPVLSVPGALADIRADLLATGTRNLVLDDDPTGTQTSHGLPVLTTWTPDDLRWALQDVATTSFVLTNTRSHGPEEARRRNREVGENLRSATDGAAKVRIVSRGDSTLRGHYPLETDVHEAQAKDEGRPYDGVLLTPCYLAAGRLTVGDVHWTRQGDDLVPVSQTEYAKDATFGYDSADLKDYVVEHSGDRWRTTDVVSLDLTTIRIGGPEAVRDLLLGVRDGRPVVVNAAAEEDLEVLVLGLQLAERQGRRFLHRCGPSLVRVLAGLEPRPPLRHDDIYASGGRPGHGLVVVGSHVTNSTRQLDLLLALPDVVQVELDVPQLLAEHDPAELLQRLATRVEVALRTADVVLTTSRRLVTHTTPADSLSLSARVSAALVGIVSAVHARTALRFVVAKGGITSSDVATAGLHLRRARVLGQVFPGMVSVWLSEQGREDRGLPYVVFAGNVGDEAALADTVLRLRGDGH